MDKYIGFDIDCKKTVACVVQKDKKDIYATIGSDVGSMRQYLKKQKQDGSKVHLVFEVSGQAGFIYDSLEGVIDTITVANPSKLTWIFRTAKKNDRIDARKMAVLLSINEIPSVYMPTKEVRQWRETILHRKKIVDKVVRAKNNIRATIKGHGLKPVDSGSWWKKSNVFWMRCLSEDAGKLWHMQLSNLLDEFDLLRSQLKRITEYLDIYLSSKPASRILQSIPGIGPRTTEAILAYTDDIERFSNYKKYCSYFGLVPKLDESGSTRRLGHINKQGPSVVRWAICESSWMAIRKSPSLRAYFDRISCSQRVRRKIAIVAVARKLLCIIRAMLLSGELFNEELVAETLELAA